MIPPMRRKYRTYCFGRAYQKSMGEERTGYD